MLALLGAQSINEDVEDVEMPGQGLNQLQLRIIAALQVDGRAPWSKISEAIGEPERTVARHGTDLLERGHVTIAALNNYPHQLILACESAAGAARLSCEALARREDVSYCYLTTGVSEIVAELGYRENLSELLTLQIPATTGLQNFTAFPVLKYFKTVRGWRTGALTPGEALKLLPYSGTDLTEWTLPESRGNTDDEIVRALQEDGRATLEAIARRVNLSQASVARRLEWLLKSGQISIRALVEPLLVGFATEAMLWVQVPPYHVETLGQELSLWPEVRYAAAIAGSYQLLVNLTATTPARLYALLSHPVWSDQVSHVRTDLVVHARKRGGRMSSEA